MIGFAFTGKELLRNNCPYIFNRIDYDKLIVPFEEALKEKFNSLREVKLPNGNLKIYLLDTDNLNYETFKNVTRERMSNVSSGNTPFDGISNNIDTSEIVKKFKRELKDIMNLDKLPVKKLNYYKVPLNMKCDYQYVIQDEEKCKKFALETEGYDWRKCKCKGFK